MSRKRNFLDSYSKEFSGIVKRAKNDDEFHCIPCNEDISLSDSLFDEITEVNVILAGIAEEEFEVLSAEDSMDRCSKQAECGDGEVTDSSESQFRFVLSRILQNANFQQETAEIDNR